MSAAKPLAEAEHHRQATGTQLVVHGTFLPAQAKHPVAAARLVQTLDR